MKLNISYPATGCQKLIDIDDENKLRSFYDKRVSHEVEGDFLGDDFKGYVFRISGGNDKQGFPMKQGVLTSQRVRLLLRDGVSCFRIRKRGEMKRKSVRGCIVSADLSVLNLVVVKKGDAEIPGLTDAQKPRRLGPKRASNIKKLFALTKQDDVRQFVVRRQVTPKKEGKKPYFKAPKIQRLITPERLQHKRQRKAVKVQRYMASRKAAETFNAMMALRHKEAKEARQAKIQKRRSVSRKLSEKVEEKPKAAPAKAAAAPAKAAAAPAKAAAAPAKAAAAPAKAAAAAPAKAAAAAPAKAAAAPAKAAAPAPKAAKKK